MIHEAVLTLKARMFPARLALTTHVYPIWSVTMPRAAAPFFATFVGRTARRPGDSRFYGSDNGQSGFPL
jgi:hypothetical protein